MKNWFKIFVMFAIIPLIYAFTIYSPNDSCERKKNMLHNRVSDESKINSDLSFQVNSLYATNSDYYAFNKALATKKKIVVNTRVNQPLFIPSGIRALAFTLNLSGVKNMYRVVELSNESAAPLITFIIHASANGMYAEIDFKDNGVLKSNLYIGPENLNNVECFIVADFENCTMWAKNGSTTIWTAASLNFKRPQEVPKLLVPLVNGITYSITTVNCLLSQEDLIKANLKCD